MQRLIPSILISLLLISNLIFFILWQDEKQASYKAVGYSKDIIGAEYVSLLKELNHTLRLSKTEEEFPQTNRQQLLTSVNKLITSGNTLLQFTNNDEESLKLSLMITTFNELKHLLNSEAIEYDDLTTNNAFCSHHNKKYSMTDNLTYFNKVLINFDYIKAGNGINFYNEAINSWTYSHNDLSFVCNEHFET